MIALDLFAGHGWGVACRRLGIEEYGVEIMPEAVATREANGMRTIYGDVWGGLAGTHDVPPYTTLIASPPCQTFSMAGGGAGRKALDDVLEAIRERAYLDPAALRAFGEKHDPRTALVLTPLAHVARDAPMFVVFEQVPPVLPVWEACAEEMRRWGYSVWTGNLQAEMYGVPQTRKRAVLIARADGIEAAPPVPTHSRYYSRDPERMDPGVLPWVSMAEALGWGLTERPFITAGNAVGRAEGVGGSGGKRTIEREKAAGRWSSRPATTVAGDPRIAAPGHHERQMNNAERVTIEEAAILQSYPPGFRFSGTKTKQFLQVGNAVPPLLAEAIGSRSAAWGMTDRPYPTVAAGGTSVGGSGARKIIYDARDRGAWVDERPGAEHHDPEKSATTVAGDPRISSRDHHEPGAQSGRAMRVTIEEAAALQSYPPGFVFSGTKTKQFLQVGNAVPPLLAEAILKGFLS